VPAQGPKGLHINRWIAGLHTNRAAISTPFRVSNGRTIVYHDALIDGSNVEISPANTLVRRPGWSKQCTASYGSDVPKAIQGAILPDSTGASVAKILLDTDQKIYDVGASSLTALYTKTTTNQTFFQQVGNLLFMSDGAVNQKFNGQAVTNNGIVAPTAAPTITNLNLYDFNGGAQTVHAWVPKATYTNATADPLEFYFLAPTGEIQWSVVPAGTTLQSQSSPPDWTTGFGVFGSVTVDGTMTWTNCGPIETWTANTVYTNSAYSTKSQMSAPGTGTKSTSGSTSVNWTVGASSAGINPSTGVTGNSNKLIVDTLGLALPTNAIIDGVSVTTFRASNRANAVSDVTVKIRKAGVAVGNNKAAPGFWPQTLHDVYTIPTSGGIKYVYGSNTDLWGTTFNVSDVANAGFGVEFTVNQGSTRTTTAAFTYPITITVFYHVDAADLTGTLFAQIVKDSNGNLQRVQTAGTSDASEPTWDPAIGQTTTDNTVTWENIGTANQLPCLFSRSYAFGFHTSSAHISTMSPLLTVAAPIIGNNVNVSSFGTADTQCDSIDIYRTTDGGSILLFDQSTPNVNASTSWTIYDTALDTDLDVSLIGPVAHANDPPPAGMTIMAFHMGRMWGISGNFLYFSAGPDCINGDGRQAWPPANVFPLQSGGTGLAATTQGLVVTTSSDVSAILGGPQTQTFWLQQLFNGWGVNSPNCITQDGDDLLLYTSQSQALSLSSGGKNEFGFSIAPTLAANFPSTTSYICVHRAGQDQGIFFSNSSTTTARFNLNAQTWDALGTPTVSIGPLASADTTIGTRRLLSTSNGFVVYRDVSTFSDAGSAYSAYATVGSIVLSEAGEEIPAALKWLALQASTAGTYPTIQVLPNEISGSFTTVPFTAADPWQLTATSTITQKRHDWQGIQSMLGNVLRHLQVKILFATEAAKNEIYTLALVP
jgi:hypothetical protein